MWLAHAIERVRYGLLPIAKQDKTVHPSRQNPADHRDNDCWWRDPHGNSGEFFKFGLKQKGSYPKLMNIKFTKEWHQIITGTFSHNWDPSHVLIIWNMREISAWKYPQGFYRERRWKILLYFSWISAGKLWQNFHRDDLLKFPDKSTWNSGRRGWLARWDVIGSTRRKLNYVEITLPAG